MTLNYFLYIISNLFLLQVLSLELLVLEQVINIICVTGIATFGVAHGAIDDILYGSSKGKSRLIFIVKYVIAITSFGLLWLVLPSIAFVVFLSVSAFHFGQTQLVELNISQKFISNILFFVWGSFVILGMFAFNKDFLSNISDNIMFIPEIYFDILKYSNILLAIVASLLFLIFVFLMISKKITFNLFLKEFYLFILIAFSFSILPPFVAFSIFFIFIHSMKAINQEYKFCRSQKLISNSLQFFLLFVPFTVYTLLFIGLFIFCLFYFQYATVIPFALVILLSAVTIPHCFVMDRFYGIK